MAQAVGENTIRKRENHTPGGVFTSGTEIPSPSGPGKRDAKDVVPRESLSEAWTHFKDLLQKVPHHGIDMWLQIQIFYDHVNPITRRTIDQVVDGKLHDKNDEESWALLEDLALYDNESWNDPRDFIKPVKAISMPHDAPSASDKDREFLEVSRGQFLDEDLAKIVRIKSLYKDTAADPQD
nr:zinc finger, CCHC-type [Tanacetum cinerariifolium]